MKLNNNQIYGLAEGLAQFRRENFKLPIKVGFNILKNIQIIQSYYETIVQMRDEIIQKYPNLEPKEDFNKDLFELGIIEQDIQLEMIDLKDIEHLKLSFNLLEKISVIIRDEVE